MNNLVRMTNSINCLRMINNINLLLNLSHILTVYSRIYWHHWYDQEMMESDASCLSVPFRQATIPNHNFSTSAGHLNLNSSIPDNHRCYWCRKQHAIDALYRYQYMAKVDFHSQWYWPELKLILDTATIAIRKSDIDQIQ